MSFPKVVIKYEIPPAPVYSPTTGGGGGGGGGGDGGGGGGTVDIPLVSTKAAGLAPQIPVGSDTAPYSFLRSDTDWARIAYSDLSSVPASFTPSPHASTHIIGPDSLPLAGAHNPGLIPPLPSDGTKFFNGLGAYLPVPLVSTSAAGLVPTAPGDVSYVLTGSGAWTRASAILPKHATSHEAGGSDAIPLDALAPPADNTSLNASPLAHGLLPKLDNVASHFFTGTGIWSPGVAGPVGPTGPEGDTGPAGINAFSTTAADFDLPALGATVQITLDDASWVTIGQMVVVQTGGGSPTDGYSLKAIDKTGNLVTFQNVGSSTTIPLAGTSQSGLLKQLSGLTTDFVDGTNNCRDLKSSVAGVTAQVPTGVVIDFAGSGAPAGWLLCDGTSYPTATYPDLFSVLGYKWGGSGANFNLPDLRSRVTVGAGQGTGLTNRVLAAKGGEETHVLLVAEMASHVHDVTHTHTMGNHTHVGPDHLHSMQNHTHLGVDHLHSMQNHTHLGVNHLHNMDHYHTWAVQGSHSHGVSSGVMGMNNPVQGLAGGGLTFYQPQGIGIAAANTPAGNTVYASQTSGSWVNTGACDRDLTTGGPSSATTGAADRGLTTGGPSVASTAGSDRALTTGGPSTNSTDGANITNTGSIGSNTGHNTMPPFAVMNKIIKT